MTKRYLKYCFVVMAVLLSATHSVAQTVAPLELEGLLLTTDNDLIGTSRYVGLAGAMTAVGGDPSAVKLNPAGLGVYRHSQFSVTGEGQFRRCWQQDGLDRGPLYSRWHLSQVSYVFAGIHPERVAGVVSNNLMISYAKRSDVLRNVTLNDRTKRTAADPDWIETSIDEYGFRNDFDIHYAMNISNRVYWGLGLTLEWQQLRQTFNRWDYQAESKRGVSMEYTLNSTSTGRSVGFAGSLGLLVHPIRPLRIGVAVESPAIGQMRETGYYTEIVSYDKAKNSQYDSPDLISRWRMTTPLKATAGVGLQFGEHGLLSMQYDLQYHKLSGVNHTARAGLELVLGRHWMLDLGYTYSTLFTQQRMALGVNYVGKWLRVGAGYTYGWNKGTINDYYYHTPQGIFRGSENKIVFTFQWNT